MKSKANVVKNSDRWGTHPEVYKFFDRLFNFTLDVCAEPVTAKCKRFFTPKQDGLIQNWGNNTCWCNPPYSRPMPWVRRAIESAQAGATVVMIVRDDCSTRWHRLATENAAEIYRIQSRLQFQHPAHTIHYGKANFPCAVFVFRPGKLTNNMPVHIYLSPGDLFGSNAKPLALAIAS